LFGEVTGGQVSRDGGGVPGAGLDTREKAHFPDLAAGTAFARCAAESGAERFTRLRVPVHRM